MPSQWMTIDGFGNHGMQPDQMPTKREPGALDMAKNCRPVGGNLRLAGGWGDYYTLPKNASTLFSQQAWSDMVMYAPGGTSIYQYTHDEGWIDITDTPFTLVQQEADQPCGRWSGGFIQGTMVFNNCGITRAYSYDPTDPTGAEIRPLRMSRDISDVTWEDLGVVAGVMRMWKGFGFAGNITAEPDDSYFPQRIMWSHPCSTPEDDIDNPGFTTLNSAPPERWDPSVDGTLAGDIDLTESPGIIVDMVPLRDQLIVYKSDAIYSVNLIRGVEVFKFRPVLFNRGIPGRDTVVEYNGLHYVNGVEDLFVFDGNTAKSVLWGVMKRFWLLDRDGLKAGNNFTSINPKHEEVLFHYCSKDSGQDYPTKAIALCLVTGALTLRDYGQPMNHSMWSRDMTSIATAAWHLYTIKDKTTVIDLETGTTQGGSKIPVEITRTGLGAADGFGWEQIDDVVVNLICDGGQTFDLELGGQVSPSAPITWRSKFAVDPTTDYKTDARQNDNLLAFRFTANVFDQWQLGDVKLLVQRSGARG